MKKKAETDIRGVSAEGVLANSQPVQAFDTPGLQKARDILTISMSGQNKVAAKRHAGSPATLPQIERLLEEKTDGPRGKIDEAKSLGGHMLAGGGSGNFLARFAQGPKVMHPGKARKLEFAGTAVGMGLGAADYVRKRRNKAKVKGTEKAKTATLASPAMSLKATKQVGKATVQTGSVGPTSTQQIRGRLIGTKGVPSSMNKTAGFLSLLFSDPNSEDLEKAFKLYEKETGKSRHKMSFQEIDTYVQKSRSSMKKTANMADSGDDLNLVKHMVLTREDTRAAADELFGPTAKENRKTDRALMDKLFLQSPAAVTLAHNLQKEASDGSVVVELTKNVDSFFEKNAKALGLTEAQQRFPELRTVKSAGILQPKKKDTSSPVRAPISGGAA